VKAEFEKAKTPPINGLTHTLTHTGQIFLTRGRVRKEFNMKIVQMMLIRH